MNISPFFVGMAVVAVTLSMGCVSFPMGTETFTADFPSDVRPAGYVPPKDKTYAVDLVIGESDETRRIATMGLVGKISYVGRQVQHYKSVTVEKRKQLAFGIMPGVMECYVADGKKPLLTSKCGDELQGEGMYKTYVQKDPTLPFFLGFYLYIPVALLYEPFFGTWECHSHHWTGKNIEYLQKFSPKEREKIGIFTSADQDAHPQTQFRSGFTHSALIGFHRYCDYEIHDPVDSAKTTPAPSKTVTADRKVAGPYSVQLELPSIGFSQTVAVPPGQTTASFRLPNPPDGGLPFANGSVRFLQPPGGLEAVRNEDDRALLKQAIQREWPVAIALPASR